MQPGKFDDVFTNQVGEVLLPPAFGIDRVFRHTVLGKAAALHQAFQGGVWRAALLLAPLTHRDWMKPERLVAARQRITALPPGFHPGAVSDQQRLSRLAAVDNSFQPDFPIRHFVDFVHRQQAAARAPALPQQYRPISRTILRSRSVATRSSR